MERKRIKLAVYVDLDPTPGSFHSADSARNHIGSLLHLSVGHYNPLVSIEEYDTSVPTGPMKGTYIEEEEVPCIEHNRTDVHNCMGV